MISWVQVCAWDPVLHPYGLGTNKGQATVFPPRCWMPLRHRARRRGAMVTLSRDTHPDAERKQVELLRDMPSWRRLELAVQMTQTCYSLALAGLRHRHPEASAAELDPRLATQVLGAELAARVYGPWPD
jgi:hypothetical protein